MDCGRRPRSNAGEAKTSAHDLFTPRRYLGDQGAEFDGGNLEFVDDFVRPRRGLLAAFSSGEESEHRVSRVTRGARYALALWYSCDDDPETAVRARFG